MRHGLFAQRQSRSTLYIFVLSLSVCFLLLYRHQGGLIEEQFIRKGGEGGNGFVDLNATPLFDLGGAFSGLNEEQKRYEK
jgi:hypothetical protein